MSQEELETLGLDHCYLVARQTEQLFETVMQSRSQATIKKIFLKNNRVDTQAAAASLCRLVDHSKQITNVSLNWSGIKLEHEPGAQIKAISTKDG